MPLNEQTNQLFDKTTIIYSFVYSDTLEAGIKIPNCIPCWRVRPDQPQGVSWVWQ